MTFNAGARLSRLIQKTVQDAEIPALTGYVQSSGSIILTDSSLGDNEIYVRLFGNQEMTKVAVNIGVAQQVNLWVGLRQNGQREYEVVRPLARENTTLYGTAAASAAQPRIDASFLNGMLIGGINLLPGRLQLASLSSMVVAASDFLYLDTAGNLQKWTSSSGSLDLTSSIPGSGLHTLALVAFNPSSSAPALTASTLTARAISYPFTNADLPSFSLAAGYIPLATVRLVNGDTALTLDRIDYNVRFFLVSKGLIVGGKIDNTVIGGTTPAAAIFTTGAVKEGNSSSNAKLGGVIFDDFADAGNTTSTETDLYTHTLPASALNTNGDALEWHIFGTSKGTATETTELKLYFGGTVVADTGAVAPAADDKWSVHARVIRDSSTSVRVSADIAFSGGVTFTASPFYATVTGLTLSNTQIFKLTGQRAGASPATNDIVAKHSKMHWYPSA